MKSDLQRLLLIFTAGVLIVPAAYADTFGRLHVQVRNVDDEKPIAGAEVIVHDSARSRPDIHLVTDAEGFVSTPPLENRAWQVTAKPVNFEKIMKEVKVTSDSVSDLVLDAEPEETTIKVASDLTRLHTTSTSSSTTRDSDFLKSFPVSADSPQQLTGLLVSTPGFVQDSVNQVHPRGEHSATSIYIQGFELEGAGEGRFGPIIDPQSLETIDIKTGSFEPEYAGDSAVLNTTIRSGAAKPFGSFELGGGNYDQALGKFTLGGQAGPSTGAADDAGNETKLFSYFLSGSALSTDNALESPQPRVQSANNRGNSENFLGRFDLTPAESDKISLILNASPAKTDVANRTGLPDKFAPYGQGYGFGGALSAAAAEKEGIVSQNDAGQDIYQKDRNNFGVLQWHHEYTDQLSSLLSFGMDESQLDTLNSNPDVNLGALPQDNSIEYNPTVKRDGKHQQISGSVSYEEGSHSLKMGGRYVHETENDSYQLIPASQLAADDLFTVDPRLAPSGVPQIDGDGNPVMDAQGNQVYLVDHGSSAPTLNVKSRGYDIGGYVQDTWKLGSGVTANYGVRYDNYRQRQDLGNDPVDADQWSPRLNLAWAFYPTWIARASYNRLFIEPSLSQGSITGESIEPERVNQYETSIEKEITSRQVAKIAYYYKDIRNQLDSGLLIPSTQLGIYDSVNFDSAAIHGVEVSYDLFPDHGFGEGGYIAYSHSIAKPGGFDSTGAPAPEYNDHDQRDTLSLGAAYTFSCRASVGTDIYYGSGVASSPLFDGGSRVPRQTVGLSISSPPDMLFDKGGVRLTVANLFDEQNRINFNSDFSGTRFEQGRMMMLSTFFNF